MNELSNLIYDLLKKIIDDAVKAALLENLPYPPVPITISDNNILTRKQAAELLHISPNTLTRYVRQGKLLPAVINGKYRFFRNDLLNFLRKNAK